MPLTRAFGGSDSAIVPMNAATFYRTNSFRVIRAHDLGSFAEGPSVMPMRWL